jgi:hypothetical protein
MSKKHLIDVKFSRKGALCHFSSRAPLALLHLTDKLLVIESTPRDSSFRLICNAVEIDISTAICSYVRAHASWQVQFEKCVVHVCPFLIAQAPLPLLPDSVTRPRTPTFQVTNHICTYRSYP